MPNKFVILSILLVCTVAVTAQAVTVEEPEIYTLRLDEATVVKGYTFVSPDGDFKVGVRDRAVEEPVTVRFKKIQ